MVTIPAPAVIAAVPTSAMSSVLNVISPPAD